MDYHYVECHVIVAEDPAGDSLGQAKNHGWWGSRIAFDTSGEEQKDDLILTTRRETPEDAINAIRGLAAILKAAGFKVTRGKTEIVTYDTKLGDEL